MDDSQLFIALVGGHPEGVWLWWGSAGQQQGQRVRRPVRTVYMIICCWTEVTHRQMVVPQRPLDHKASRCLSLTPALNV